MEIAEHSAIPLLVLTRLQDHVEIVNSTLRKAGHAAHCHWVGEINDLNESLMQVNAHMLLAFVGADAAESSTVMEIVKRAAPRLAVLLVRDEVDETIIAAAMQLGARDVVTLKHPARLQAVVTRELHAFRLERNLSSTVNAAREYREQFKALMAGSADAIAQVQEGILIDANPAWLELFGYAGEDNVVGQPLMDSFEPGSHAALKGALVACLQGKWQNNSVLKASGSLSDGSSLSMDLQFELIEVEAEPAIQISIASQKNDTRELDAQLTEALEKDASTGFFQRRFFIERLRASLANAVQGGVRELLCIEPDKFAAIADKTGPAALEEFVAQFAEVVKAHLQAGELLGRFGDCMLMILMERGTRGDIEAWGATLLRKIAAHIFAIGDKSLSCTCSIGVGLVEAHSTTIEIPLSDALKARALAAEQGGNKLHTIDHVDDDTQRQVNDKIWVKHIKAALMENRFRLMQQPIASLLGDDKGMYDVLVRMLDEQGKDVLPSEFITAAERNDLMKNIDRWVIGAAMGVCGSRPVKRLFVKLSKDSVIDRSLPQWLSNQLRSTRIDPARVAFEISEKVAASHLAQSVELATALHQAGFKLAIEHFGANHDSLRLLEQLPVEYLKVDGTLMQGLATNHDQQESVRRIVDVAKSRKISTIAERVEDANTMAVLWQLGIEFIQGYFVTEPEQVTM